MCVRVRGGTSSEGWVSSYTRWNQVPASKSDTSDTASLCLSCALGAATISGFLNSPAHQHHTDITPAPPHHQKYHITISTTLSAPQPKSQQSQHVCSYDALTAVYNMGMPSNLPLPCHHDSTTTAPRTVMSRQSGPAKKCRANSLSELSEKCAGFYATRTRSATTSRVRAETAWAA